MNSVALKKESLETLLHWVYDNNHSSFYRGRLLSVYKDLFPLTDETWDRVPFLSRDEMTSARMWDRVMVPPQEVDTVRHTYGTSGKRILITPKCSYGSYEHPYGSMRRHMCFFAAAYNEFPRAFFPQQQVWFGDVGNLDASAKIAAKGSVDALFITPYTALLFAEKLALYGALERVRIVQLTGERCSPLQYKKLRELYFNATVYSVFSSSETREAVAAPCRHDMEAGGSHVLAAAPEVHCEIVDPTTGARIQKEGVSGEFVITTIAPHTPFPLIRYRTGDVARYTQRACVCDRTQKGFEILGRWSVFPVRLVKGELTIDAVEQALKNIPHIDTSYFEVHYDEELSERTALPRITLSILKDAQLPDVAVLADRIAKLLLVFPGFTYAQGVASSIYLPLRVRFLEKAPRGPLGKPGTPIIVRHVSGSAEEQRAAVRL